MLGITRFVLSILVLLSHTSGAGFPLNPGVASVIIFYFISGHLMRRSYLRFAQHSSTPIRDFYLDRILKLFPQYAIVVLASFIAIACLGPAENVLFLNQQASLQKVVLNLLLLPANYVFPPLVVQGMLPHPIIPPAWSLAAEFHFYLLLPWICLLGRRSFVALVCVTLSISVAAMFFGTGSFNSDNFGYRYIFGVLTFFLAGFAYTHADEAFYRRVLTAIWATYLVMLILIAPSLKLFTHPHVLEVLLGATLAWPLVKAALSSPVRQGWMKTLDDRLGRLAYPIFISHFLAFYLCEKLLGFRGQSGLQIPVIIIVCLCLSLALQHFQQKVDGYRMRLRGFSSMLGKPA